MTVSLAKFVHTCGEGGVPEDGVTDCDWVFEMTHQGEFRATLDVLRTIGGLPVELNRNRCDHWECGLGALPIDGCKGGGPAPLKVNWPNEY